MPRNDRTFNAEAFRAIRKARRLRQVDVAAMAGVSVSYIKLIEKGDTQPRPLYLRALASVLECSPDDFTEDAAA